MGWTPAALRGGRGSKDRGTSRAERCQSGASIHQFRNGGAEMNRTTYGLDVAKRVFQMYWVDVDTGEIVNRRFSRAELIEFLSKSSAGRVALEACGSGHWWARKIRALGH